MAVLAPSQPLTERSATDLARAIRHRETSSRDVVEAHIERIEYMHERINAVVIDRFDAARSDADADAADTGQFPTTHTEIAAQMLTIGPIVRRGEDRRPTPRRREECCERPGRAPLPVL